MRRFLLAFLAFSSVACAASTPPLTVPKVATPPALVTNAPAGPDVFVIEGPLREEWLPLLRPPLIDPAKTQLNAAPAALEPAPASCDAFAKRTGLGAVACTDTASALTALDGALAEGDPARRDGRLVDLEACTGLPAGIVRALRAEVAPAECGEAITAPLLKTPPPGMTGAVYHALLGQAIASRLSRAATAPPVFSAPHTRARADDFTRGPMKKWFSEQATVIQDVSQAAVELPYYARGITAMEAGVAEMRLIDIMRSVPLPDEMANDADLRNQYYASLDQGLDPRKNRGRDAALVGLREMALVGALGDPRVVRARAILSRHYGGRRIDALDGLLLPPLSAAQPATVEERLAAKLPAFYASLLLDEQAASRAGTLRQLLARGLPLPQRNALRTAALTPEARGLYARARIELGRLYWRAVDFDQAAALASSWPKDVARPADVTFVLALSIALRNGPDDAADMMRKAPSSLTSMGKVDALDALASAIPNGPYAPIAAFDAALIRELTAPQGAPATYWKDVAQRFRAAAALLVDPKDKARATERATAADQIAAAIK